MKFGRDNYNRLYELLTLINAMRGTLGGLTYDDIQDKFGWERKTVERMLRLIENTYMNSFVKERGDGNKMFYRLARGDAFPPGFISESEVVALRTALGFVKTNEPLRLPLESLAGKLESLNNDAAVCNIEDMTLASGTASAPRPYIKFNRKVMETLQTAILTYRVVKVKYRRAADSAAMPFSVCPLGFLYGTQNNYLIASHIDRTARPRHYTLDQIQSVALTPKTFDAKGFDLRKYSEKSFGSWIGPGDGYKVKWKVRPEAADRASRFVFHPTQKVTPQKDGGLIVEFTADGLREMAYHLITWAGGIKPLAPKELIDEYKNLLKLAANALK
jgi:predicted DNA-binding transcriptional regulator YafY